MATNPIENMTCPNCENFLFQKVNKKLKLRTNIIIFEKAIGDDYEDAGIKCPTCKTFVKVPIKIEGKTQIEHVIIDKK